MECREIQERLSAYHDGELSPNVAEAVRQHLNECVTCSEELAGFHGMSSLLANAKSPAAPDDWATIDATLHPAAPEVRRPNWLLFPQAWRQFALAASVFLAFVVGLLAVRSESNHARAADLSAFATAFPGDPARAEQRLLAAYNGQPVELANAAAALSYRPMLADGLPAGYTLKSAHILQMPCCKCLQAVYSRKDGSMLCLFERLNDQEVCFGNRPAITANCAGRATRLVQFGDCLAADWQAGSRTVTAVGAHDVSEIVRLVNHFDKDENRKM